MSESRTPPESAESVLGKGWNPFRLALSDQMCHDDIHFVDWQPESNNLAGGIHTCLCRAVVIHRALNIPDCRIVTVTETADKRLTLAARSPSRTERGEG